MSDIKIMYAEGVQRTQEHPAPKYTGPIHKRIRFASNYGNVGDDARLYFQDCSDWTVVEVIPRSSLGARQIICQRDN